MSFNKLWWFAFSGGLIFVLGLLVAHLANESGLTFFALFFGFSVAFFTGLRTNFGSSYEEWSDRNSPGSPYRVRYDPERPLLGGFCSGMLAVYVAMLLNFWCQFH